MPRFEYHALDDQGRPTMGDVEADDMPQAVAQLQANGLRLQSIAVAMPAPSPGTADSTIDAPRAAPDWLGGSDVEFAVLKSHMATILERGRSIAPALEAYAEELPSGWQRRQLIAACGVLRRSDSNEAATTLTELPEFWIPLLSAADTTHDPGLMLREFLDESQSVSDLRHKWWLTLSYPLILAGLAMLVMTALSIFVIPEFGEIFREFDLTLPTLTEFVVRVADLLSSWGIVFLVAVAGLLLLILLYSNRLLPIAGAQWLRDWIRPPFSRRTMIARFARFLADLLEAGVSIPDALRIAGFTIEPQRARRAAWQLAKDLEANGGFSQEKFRRSLSSLVVYALAPEMPSDSRVRLLREVSSCHAERVRVGLSWTTGIIEPLAIILVGLVVGCTVLGLFLPLVKLVEGLSM